MYLAHGYLLVVTAASENVLPHLLQVASSLLPADAQTRVQLQAQGFKREPGRESDPAEPSAGIWLSCLNGQASASTPSSLRKPTNGSAILRETPRLLQRIPISCTFRRNSALW
jgi:hypothetical protein